MVLPRFPRPPPQPLPRPDNVDCIAEARFPYIMLYQIQDQYQRDLDNLQAQGATFDITNKESLPYKLMMLRLVGYLLLYAPSKAGIQDVVNGMVAYEFLTPTEAFTMAMVRLGEWYFKTYIRACAFSYRPLMLTLIDKPFK